MAPVWIAMSKTLAFSSSKPSSDPARIRWPVLEIGRNSVSPSTTPSPRPWPATQRPRALLYNRARIIAGRRGQPPESGRRHRRGQAARRLVAVFDVALVLHRRGVDFANHLGLEDRRQPAQQGWRLQADRGLQPGPAAPAFDRGNEAEVHRPALVEALDRHVVD